jgi:hypothetical protein
MKRNESQTVGAPKKPTVVYDAIQAPEPGLGLGMEVSEMWNTDATFTY